MSQAEKNQIAEILGGPHHLDAFEAQLAMKNESMAQTMKTQIAYLKVLDALQKKGPKTIVLNENTEPHEPMMRAITSTDNLGNTCYANSVVFYGLRFIPLFTEKLHNWVKKSVGIMPRKGKRMLEVFQALHIEYLEMSASERRNDLWSEVEQSVETPVDTSLFLCVMRELAPEFVEGEQHDAAALLNKMLEWLKNCSDILKEWANKTDLRADIEQVCFYDEYFMGKEVEKIKCLGCGHTKDGPRLEPSVISVPVPRGMTDMTNNNWIIENLLRSDERDEHNCENCQAQPRPKAEINTLYELLPRLLILQMKYEADLNGSVYVKADGLVPLPLELECFCVECKDGQRHHKYHLNSIVMHVGATYGSGHYFTFVHHLNPGGNNDSCCRIKLNTGAIRGKNVRETWLKCDDRIITVLSQDDMDNNLRNENQKPHLVFYARNDIVSEDK